MAHTETENSPELLAATQPATSEPKGKPPQADMANSPDIHNKAEEDAAAVGFAEQLARLPRYSRSLLKIPVPVIVTLATTKQPIGRVLELVPGSIIQFDKLCDETLRLEVNNQVVALGEAVKIGDKFGLRLTSIALPEERYERLGVKE